MVSYSYPILTYAVVLGRLLRHHSVSSFQVRDNRVYLVIRLQMTFSEIHTDCLDGYEMMQLNRCTG